MWSNASALNTIKQWQFADIELICTGTTMKWVSVSQSQLAGEFVYVEAPAVVADIDLDNLCPMQLQGELPSGLTPAPVAQLDITLTYQVQQARLLAHPYTFFAYQHGQSRAPPHP
ncbi:hypothetical protein LJ739_12865 [Aestuariibacter halophilus]|uniref:Uncharacterized protein n=2 Tax=Fluctibacter halophilus TaxID=226011 RepID=A0ABS8G992_9ALTE|nr:hypothetical protein [Aestuariibacter halophilus]